MCPTVRARRGWQCPGKPAAPLIAVLERRRRAEAVAGFKDGAADAGEGARRELADCGDEAGDADGPGVMTCTVEAKYSSSPEEQEGRAGGGVYGFQVKVSKRRRASEAELAYFVEWPRPPTMNRLLLV